MRPVRSSLVAVAAAAALATPSAQETAPFRSAVDLIDVTVTVTDRDDGFVGGLGREDFRVYEDGVLQDVQYFSSDPVPVSLGIALDTSGSMTPDKMASARSAISRFANDLLGPEDELFYMQFANRPDLVQGWTTDRRAIRRAMASAFPAGGTAMYDAIAEALPLAQTGAHRKRALLVISDGNDTISETSLGELRQRIRATDVLVYALAVDGQSRPARRAPPIFFPPPSGPLPVPGRLPRRGIPRIPPITGGTWGGAPGDRVNADALRQITQPSGGRTELLRGFDDLGDATARIADELNRQYQLGYASTGARDGRWHAIRVEVAGGQRFTIRARSGFLAPAS